MHMHGVNVDITVTAKKIYTNGVWETRKFYRIPNYSNWYRAGNKLSKLETWCIEKHGEPSYQGKWFKTSDHIILDESTYVLWIWSS